MSVQAAVMSAVPVASAWVTAACMAATEFFPAGRTILLTQLIGLAFLHLADQPDTR